MAQSGATHDSDLMYDWEEDLSNKQEDRFQPTLGTAKVEGVLPSMISVWQVVRYYQEPLPD